MGISIGQVYGKWTVMAVRVRTDAGNRRRTYGECRCECGTVKEVESYNLRTGKSTGCTSCGLRTHGSSDTKEYHIWEAMKNRCTSPGNRQYQDYGGRGISYDPRWEQFEHFIADMGLCPEGMTLERVDNSAGYNKDNCKWASWVENLSNTRKNVKVTVRGHTHHLAEWVRIIGKEVGRSMRKYKKDNKCTWAVAIEFYLQKYHIDMEKLG